EAVEDRDERRHVVAAVGIVRIDPGHGGELALPVLDREQRGHHRLALVVGAAEEVTRVGDLLVDAVLGRAIPINRQRAGFLHLRPERQPDAGRDDALYAVHLLLLHELAEAFDRILGRAFLLDDELDFTAGDAAGGVEPFSRPLGRANAVLPRGRCDTGA